MKRSPDPIDRFLMGLGFRKSGSTWIRRPNVRLVITGDLVILTERQGVSEKVHRWSNAVNAVSRLQEMFG